MKGRAQIFKFITTGFLFICPGIATGQIVLVDRLNTIFNPSPTLTDLFASRMTFISSEEALIGARGTDTGFAQNVGVSYLINPFTEVLLQTYQNPFPNAEDNFGLNSVAVDDLVVIGAHADDTIVSNGGAAYVFDKSTGLHLRTLSSPNVSIGGFFGLEIIRVGKDVLIGAPGDIIDGTSSGAAYLMDPNTGDLVRTFQNPTPENGDRFGIRAATFGDDILIGADSDQSNGNVGGAAYRINRRTGTLVQTYENPTPSVDDRFGITMAGFAGRVIVGADRDDTMGIDAGAVYVFDADTAQFERAIFSPNPVDYECFGQVVPLSNWVIIGAPSVQFEGRFLEGRTYLFDPLTGNHIHTFVNPFPDEDDYFGNHAAVLDGRFALIGAWGDDRGANNAGVAYLYEVVNPSSVESWQLFD